MNRGFTGMNATEPIVWGYILWYIWIICNPDLLYLYYWRLVSPSNHVVLPIYAMNQFHRPKDRSYILAELFTGLDHLRRRGASQFGVIGRGPLFDPAGHDGSLSVPRSSPLSPRLDQTPQMDAQLLVPCAKLDSIKHRTGGYTAERTNRSMARHTDANAARLDTHLHTHTRIIVSCNSNICVVAGWA
jgi:hypothetical protein